MNALIYISNKGVEEFRRIAAADVPEVTFRTARTEEEALAQIEGAEILVALVLSGKLLAKAKNLKWIHAIIAGTDAIENLPEFKARPDVVLTSSRGIHGPQVSELVMMLMIALNRRFPQVVRNQELRKWEAWPAPLLYRKKAAILGMGTIGQSLARKCKAFDMTVFGIGPHPKQVDALDDFFLTEETTRVAAQVDYFVSTAPATPQTRRFLGAAFFDSLKPGAFFINVGRGEVVDEAALVDALRRKKLAGAALDTFQQEPLPAEHPFWGMDNVIVTPHVGGMSDVYIQQTVGIFQENLKRYLRGGDMINLVPRAPA